MTGNMLTASQVAALTGVNPKTVTRWARDGKLPFTTTLGGHRRYRKEDIERLIVATDADPRGAGTAEAPGPDGGAD